MAAWRTLLGAFGVAMTVLLLGGGCSLIISSELSHKLLPGGTGGSGGAPGTGGSVRDSGSEEADAPHGCQHDTDCSATPALPACNVATGVCVECLPGGNTCPPSFHCSDAMTCVASCETSAQCPSLTEANVACTNGVCVLASCASGYGDCDGVVTNGCEVNLEVAPSNCGTCGNVCSDSVLNAAVVCTSGMCDLKACDPGFADCDKIANNGCEVDTNTDVNNCGGCGMICKLPNAASACMGGTCVIAACASGFRDCNNTAADGCEVSEYTDIKNCGACGTGCFFPNATSSCNVGVCQIDSCAVGYADCDGIVKNGCEIKTDADPKNCGACGMICSNNHGTPGCAAGVCTIACDTGYKDCNGNVANGCEAQTSADVANCGACGHVCPPTGGTPNCIAGTCGFASCLPGLGDCNNTGCNTDLTKVANCGGCGIECTTPNGTPACTMGACATGSCNPGYADCNGDPVDGCEAQTTTIADCGGCGQVCALPHANPTCTTGTCGILSCIAPFANCDGSAGNGCEADTSASALNCGACGVACNAINGAPSCSGGKCSITCSSGFGDCNANPSDGCETNLKTDPDHCGGCSTACSLPHAIAACSNGTCAVGSCIPPYADCDGIAANGCETDTSSSPGNCGGCGTACNGQNGMATCIKSACGIVCSAGFANCDGKLTNGCEVVLGADVNNCNACGNACPSTNGTPNCVNGMCGFASCNPGFGACTGGGCSTMLMIDVANCGACGNVCNVANGTGTCTNGVCAIASCNAGYKDCDGSYANGCETSLKTNTDCGGCGVPCALPNATSSCTTGSCLRVACVGSFADCDGNPANGCVTDLSGDVANCGACGNKCSTVNASPSCSAGACVLTCHTGFGDCDQNLATGCETNTTNNPFNCGACGRACAATNVASLDCNMGSCDSTCAPGFANCNEPMQPLPDDGCELNVTANETSCGSCTNSCAMQGAASQPLVCGAGNPSVCGCQMDASCQLPGAGGTCAMDGNCVCSGLECNVGEVCLNQGADACSCNGGAACTAPQTCCQVGCVDLTSTAGSCGACGNACPPGFACQSSQCVCAASQQCNAGGGGTCVGGACQCGATTCAAGQRCQPGGVCG